ncbi:TadE/TadG family type IV pilus assembly protein [Rhizobium sp. RM]|uniref:TadE/TadG family type IV pilus assembly protein n=1 Tax=Rhizobium sp. RM TaxID=2748079 RepID=UPI00110E9916|nr:TadE/TadG family type IV pilus assembly protein [Rhizobium sp. RM]NWJ24469.1 pilus assembly protein [Rhizobium sp. RM]TMV16287.1 pilus assembly protein [Rhizobium sp. Td3]
MIRRKVSLPTLSKFRLPAVFARFARDRRGVGAVEFAIIFPILVALYLTSFELTLGYSAYKRASHATATINDLVSKKSSVDKAYLQTTKDVTAAIFAPYSTSGLKLKISGIKIDDKSQAKIAWSWDQDNLAPYAKGSSVTVPKGLVAANTFLVHVEFSLPHNLLMFMSSLSSSVQAFTIKREYFFKQRDQEITCSDC